MERDNLLNGTQMEGEVVKDVQKTVHVVYGGSLENSITVDFLVDLKNIAPMKRAIFRTNLESYLAKCLIKWIYTIPIHTNCIE